MEEIYKINIKTYKDIDGIRAIIDINDRPFHNIDYIELLDEVVKLNRYINTDNEYYTKSYIPQYGLNVVNGIKYTDNEEEFKMALITFIRACNRLNCYVELNGKEINLLLSSESYKQIDELFTPSSLYEEYQYAVDAVNEKIQRGELYGINKRKLVNEFVTGVKESQVSGVSIEKQLIGDTAKEVKKGYY